MFGSHCGTHASLSSEKLMTLRYWRRPCRNCGSDAVSSESFGTVPHAPAKRNFLFDFESRILRMSHSVFVSLATI